MEAIRFSKHKFKQFVKQTDETERKGRKTFRYHHHEFDVPYARFLIKELEPSFQPQNVLVIVPTNASTK